MRVKDLTWREFHGLFVARILGMQFTVETRAGRTTAYFMGEELYRDEETGPLQTAMAKRICQTRAEKEIVDWIEL